MEANPNNRRREPSPESPNKRHKPQDQPNSPPPEPQTNESLKTSTDTNSDVCGICLSEASLNENHVSRGCLDSCDHFFCFVCIMEWAKVDSKCPLCKRRFSTIRRPPKPPVFQFERIVHIPVRDQVFDGDGNVTTGPLDLYSDCKCSVCQDSKDESLLLLCDLCDCASHTYCVGLGATVPDGDWFCQDCALLKAEQAQIDQVDSDCSNPGDTGNSCESTSNHVSIFDILQEPSGCRGNFISGILSSSRNGSDTRMPERVEQRHTDSDVRTLQRCRNVNNRIQVLRGNNRSNNRITLCTIRSQSSVQYVTEHNSRNVQQHRMRDRLHILRDNWNKIRSGSLGFSGNVSDCASTTQGKVAHQPSSTSNSHKGLKSKKNSAVASTESGSCDIDKAWKMMNFAKSLEQRKSSQSQTSKVLMPKIQEVGAVNVSSTNQKKQNQRQSFGKTSGSHWNKMPEMKKNQGEQTQKCGTLIQDSLGMRPALQYGLQAGSDGQPADKSRSIVPYPGLSDGGMSVSSSFTVKPPQTARDSKGSNLELHAYFNCQPDPPEQNSVMNRGSTDRRSKETDDAKSEIRTLVKLNLKLLTKDKNLEVRAFKDVARLATHSILAACGLETPKPGIHEFHSCGCHHSNDDHLVPRSTLMPNSCRKCFYRFVKEVVSKIIFDRIGRNDAHGAACSILDS